MLRGAAGGNLELDLITMNFTCHKVFYELQVHMQVPWMTSENVYFEDRKFAVRMGLARRGLGSGLSHLTATLILLLIIHGLLDMHLMTSKTELVAKFQGGPSNSCLWDSCPR